MLLLALLACGPDVAIARQKIDADNDGYDAEIDCDDTHATVNPDADEVCDELDNDCDGSVDEEPTDGATYYADADNDGAGDEAAPVVACEAPEGTAGDGADCNDAEPAAFPGNTEV